MDNENTHQSAADKARTDLLANQAEQLAELERKFRVLEMLPAAQRNPIVCNFRKDPSPFEPRAWVSYSAPAYDPESKFNPVLLLRDIEARGWELLPEASLIQWDNYRRAPYPCTLEIAEQTPRSRYTFTEGGRIAAYWVSPEQYTQTSFVAFMRAPDGLVYRVSVEVPHSGASVYAERVEVQGDWYFRRGSARLIIPPHWKTEQHSRAYVDTQKGISGVVYFPIEGALTSAADALAFLITTPQTTQ